MSALSEGIQETVVTLKELTEDEKKLQCEARERYEHDQASAIGYGIRQGITQGKTEIALEIAQVLAISLYPSSIPF